jgi:hypothetical protein
MNKDDLKMDLHGLERRFWLGTKAGRIKCYYFPGKTWAGDGSAHKGGNNKDDLKMDLHGLEQQFWLGTDLCYSQTTLDKVSRWIGRGPRATLAGDANADIMKIIIECVRERVVRGARTFTVKIRAHRRASQGMG